MTQENICLKKQKTLNYSTDESEITLLACAIGRDEMLALEKEMQEAWVEHNEN